VSRLLRVAAVIAALSLSAVALPAMAQTVGGDPVVDYSSKDAAMNAAIDEARRTLPMFWADFGHPDRRGTDTLKVAIPDADGGREHIWVNRIARVDGVYTARLANEPARLPGLTLGSQIRFAEDQISDWSYEKKGRLWGSFTTRVMLPDLDPSDAAQLRAYLSDTPTEPTDR
jgi:uncharacterized protein YegJ (DUF2314 family)